MIATVKEVDKENPRIEIIIEEIEKQGIRAETIFGLGEYF